jgi:hypothetical protein
MLGSFISPDRYAELLANGRCADARMLELDPGVLARHYNRQPFAFSHRLAGSEYFALPRLFDLCRRMEPRQIQYRVGEIPGDAHFDSSFERYREGLSLADALDRFEESRAYVVIYNPERDPQYRTVIESLLAEIAVYTEHLDPVMTWYSTYIFLSTRDAVTPYHMDREMNFLFQVRGSKRVQLWDPADPNVMTDEEKDRLLAHVGERPVFKESLEASAQTFDLQAGMGVHHPFIAPHRVYTGPELSVTLAITYRTRGSDVRTDAHKFNTKLRNLGWRPQPVSGNPRLDRRKSAAMRLIRRVRGVTKRARTEPA